MHPCNEKVNKGYRPTSVIHRTDVKATDCDGKGRQETV